MPKKTQSFFSQFILGIAFLILLSFLPIWITPTVAGVTFKPPGAQAPKRSSGGASRDGNLCGFAAKESASASVTPLIPATNIGFTVAEHPTILVYIPTTTAKTALFTLQTEDSKNSYQTTLPLTQK